MDFWSNFCEKLKTLLNRKILKTKIALNLVNIEFLREISEFHDHLFQNQKM